MVSVGRKAAAVKVIVFALFAAPAGATTKGLNQIVTPDIQPAGVFSVSFQQAEPNIANRYQVQLELGITTPMPPAMPRTATPCFG